MKPQVMVVEDEFLLALSLAEVVEEAGAAVVGPFSRLVAAWNAAQEMPVDAALLDVRIDGGTVFPVAKALSERSVPFAFVTANTGLITAALFAGAPVFSKPFDPGEVRRFLDRALRERGESGEAPA